MKYHNIVVRVSNYATDALDEALKICGQEGYKLVNTLMAENKYGIDIMYLFFTKEITK